MTEHLLQYLWNYKIFTDFNFQDTEGNYLEIIDFGRWNFNSGPDFLFGKIRKNGVILAGHIELHLKSSDYILHRHSGNPEFDNLILHAVFFDDVQIPEFKEKHIPTLELRHHIAPDVIEKYAELSREKRFIPCENLFHPSLVPINFVEETLLKKLNEKAAETDTDFRQTLNNYEEALFRKLLYAFGLKVNADIFAALAASLDFGIVTKIRQNKTAMEALLFGKAGFLEHPEDDEMQLWKREYDFLKAKYQLGDSLFRPKFSRFRPPNFPTLRLAQFADFYCRTNGLAATIRGAKNLDQIRQLFAGTRAGSYWDNHYNFGKISAVNHPKVLSEDFINLVIINAILPWKYACHRGEEEDAADNIVGFYEGLPAERNSVTEAWAQLGVQNKNAAESQAWLYHYKNYCQVKNCLNCSIGYRIFKL